MHQNLFEEGFFVLIEQQNWIYYSFNKEIRKSSSLNVNIEYITYAQEYLNLYIIPIINLINDQKYNIAVGLYMTMTNSLRFLYDLNHISISKIEIENSNTNESGHGIYETKKITQNV